MTEKWKCLTWIDEHYSISNLGNVKRNPHVRTRKNGLSPTCISNCCNGKGLSSGGYKWHFATPDEIAEMKSLWATTGGKGAVSE